MTYLIILIVSAGFAGLLYHMAGKRGANPTFWAIMGFAFGPLAIPFVFFAKKDDTRQPKSQQE